MIWRSLIVSLLLAVLIVPAGTAMALVCACPAMTPAMDSPEAAPESPAAISMPCHEATPGDQDLPAEPASDDQPCESLFAAMAISDCCPAVAALPTDSALIEAVSEVATGHLVATSERIPTAAETRRDRRQDRPPDAPPRDLLTLHSVFLI
ncbi:MAG: hypothetical protein AAF604_07635 [Acidobacteriota bacterium]